MLLPLSAMLLSAQLVMPVAENVPDFDISPTCHGVNSAGVSNRDLDSCLSQERAARTELSRDWAQFPARDRTTCMDSTSMGGIPSYVEMLTCLEIARDVRNMPSSTTTTGSSAPQ